MTKPNKLINEKSPYLLQHAYNPVNWYPWGEEAFLTAKIQNKPIFLSIGYSTCYWCHVMEREVFENDKIAKLMNEMFINIKVDREERPDIDRIYMTALQAMTGSVGWPMSMFLTYDLKPFYGATYIPPYSKYGLPGFEDIIIQIDKIWKSRKEEIFETGSKIIEVIKQASENQITEKEFDNEIFNSAYNQFKGIYDEEYGGFGSAPKFPRAPGMNYLFYDYFRFNRKDSLQMAIRTLFFMARGGICDHLGGGFHRYSVDRWWRTPHFEKMLYDQALITINYIDAFKITKEDHFKLIAAETLKYVSEKLTDANGGFHSAEDAESAIDLDNPKIKQEGAYYVWNKTEIDKLLSKDSEILCYYYGITEEGNVPSSSDPHNVFVKKNILYNSHSIKETAEKFDLQINEAASLLNSCKQVLLNARNKRPAPFKDDKILTSWNALMISAFAKAYQVFNVTEYVTKAINAAEFIINNLYDKNSGILLHRYRDNNSDIEGTLNDYSFFINSLIDIYECTFDEKYLKFALELSEIMINVFYDRDNFGFFDTSSNDNSIIVRTKEDYDSAEPTGNAYAIISLVRLSYITDKSVLYDIAYKSIKSFYTKIYKMPYSMPQMLIALDMILNKPKQFVIYDAEKDLTANKMLEIINSKFIPNKIIIMLNNRNQENTITFAKEIINQNISSDTKLFICENFSCKLPISNFEELEKLI
jgi:uncharacterized protein YyaL (SSP411 family)